MCTLSNLMNNVSQRPLALRGAAVGHVAFGTAALVLTSWVFWEGLTASPCVLGTAPHDVACAFTQAVLAEAAVATAVITPLYLFAGLQLWGGRGTSLRAGYVAAITMSSIQLLIILWALAANVGNSGLGSGSPDPFLAVYSAALILLILLPLSASARSFVWN
jgi:hypothetical protein